jgi:hypothetical protein
MTFARQAAAAIALVALALSFQYAGMAPLIARARISLGSDVHRLVEGYDLVVVPLGHTDTDYTTCLHVLSFGGSRRCRL